MSAPTPARVTGGITGSGMTAQSVRRHRWTLAGPAATQVVGALIVSVMMLATYSVSHSLDAAQLRTPAVHDVQEFLAIFRGNARFLSAIVVGVTMSLATAGQLRDIALLRSIGAAPAQVRWNLVQQAVLVSVPASLVGFLLAIPVCAGWLTLLSGHGVLPADAGFQLDPSVVFSAVLVELVAALVGTLIAVFRASRMRPARALVRADRGAAEPGRLRTVVGLSLLVGGAVLSVVLSLLSATVADAAGIFVLIGQSIGVGLLGPWLLRRVTALLRRVTGRGIGRVALDDLDAMSGQLSGALVPLVLAVSFTAIQNGLLTTAAHADAGGDATERWMTLSGTVSTALFAAVAAVNCLITTRTARRRQLATMQVSGASRRDLMRMSVLQTAVFAGSTLVIGAVITVCTLVPIAHTAYDTWLPSLPGWGALLGASAVFGLVGAGLVLPTRRLTRTHPMRVLRVGA